MIKQRKKEDVSWRWGQTWNENWLGEDGLVEVVQSGWNKNPDANFFAED